MTNAATATPATTTPLAGALPGAVAAGAWGLFRLVPAAYLPVTAPPHMAARGTTLASGAREVLALAGIGIAGALDAADRQRGGDGLAWWQTGGIVAASAAPMLVSNIVRTGNTSPGAFAARLALGAGLAFAVGAAVDPLFDQRR